MMQPHNRCIGRGMNIQFRIMTFINWGGSYASIEELARAGFFYLGVGRNVMCAFCSGNLQNYDPARQDALLDHAAKWPCCPYILNLPNYALKQE